MLYLFTAHQTEASPLIKELGLQHDFHYKGQQVYRGEEIMLAVTGIGKLEATVGTTRVLTSELKERRQNNCAAVLNIGISGSLDEGRDIGTIHFIHKITDMASQLSYFPDAVIKHGLNEAALITVDQPARKDSFAFNGLSSLVDMEASGFYTAASKFVPSSQIACLKIVSDHMEPSLPSRSFVSDLIKRNMKEILFVLNAYKESLQSKIRLVSADDDKIIKELTSTLKLTRAQTNVLDEMARSYLVKTEGNLDALKKFCLCKPVSKYEVKKIFGEVKSALL